MNGTPKPIQQTVAEWFAADIARHEMKIELDQPPHRSIVFKRPDSSTFMFRLVTYPGGLCITGDVETFVFERSRDMFEFFRGERVNLGYWAEKIQATSKNGGHHEFDPERFLTHVDELIAEADPEDAEELREKAVVAADDGEISAMLFLSDHGAALVCDGDFPLFRKPTSSFTWCCHAIVWAIAKYDAHHAAAPKEPQ